MSLKVLLTNRYAILSACVLMFGLLLSLLASKFLFNYNAEQQRLWIERHAESQSEQLQISINSALNSLSSISAFFQVQESINQDRFFKFVKSDAAIKTGFTALAWVPRITHEKRPQFEREMGRLLRGYRSITEMNSHGLLVPAQTRNEYYPVQHIFSLTETELFIGLNITSQFNLRRNLDDAIKKGNLIISTAKHSSTNQTTLQAYYPVYRLDKDSESSEFNHEDLIGFAVGLFDLGTLIQNTFSNQDELNLALFDVDIVETRQLLYKSDSEYMNKLTLENVHDLSKLNIPYWTRYFNVGDRTWLGVFISKKTETTPIKVWLPYIGLFIGMLITSLLSIYLFIALLRGKQILNLKHQLLGSEQLITSQENAIKAQTKLTQKLETESNEKTRFLHALGHDLKQPLSTLGLYLAQFKPEDEENKNILNKTRLTLKSLNNMFESLLEMTRLESGSIHPDKQDIELNVMFKKLQQEFELPVKEKGLEFRVRCGEVIINSDPVLLERTIRNLLVNAIKFTDRGKILLACRKQKNNVSIYVMDTGQGIEKNKYQEIFIPYTSGNASTQEPGLGLGLAIVKQTMDLLGYQIQVFSSLNTGTCFKISIPD